MLPNRRIFPCCIVATAFLLVHSTSGTRVEAGEPNALSSGAGMAPRGEQAFQVAGLPLTFRYPATWSQPSPDETSYVVRGPKGFRGIPLEIEVCRIPKAESPNSSAWKQVVRAQDQLTQQDGLLLRMSERSLGALQVPYVLVAFPMGRKTEGLPVLNVLQFVIDHDQAYFWLCFSGPSDIWEANSAALKRVFESVRLLKGAPLAPPARGPAQ